MDNHPIICDSLCTLCGKCVSVCPKEVLEIKEKKVQFTEQECMLCSQCLAVCPEKAVSFSKNEMFSPDFKTFTYKEEYIDSESINPSDFINILRSRRSVRSYKETIPDRNIILDLITSSVTAPSGSNCQDWDFTVINGREKVWKLALKMKDSVKKINSIVKNPIIRFASIPFPGSTLQKYYEHIESIEWAIEEAEKGRDILFHGAPTLIIFHSHLEGSTPLEDAQYASYNCTLVAHAMGLGTCYIGYATEILNRFKKIKSYCQIPENHRVHAVLTLGYPNVTYTSLSHRKNYKVNFI